jgi:hypothetical protein
MPTRLVYSALILILSVSCGDAQESSETGEAGKENEAGDGFVEILEASTSSKQASPSDGCSHVESRTETEGQPVEPAGDPNHSSQASSYDFCLVTHTTVSPYIYPQLTAANHAAYAKLHGYRQRAYFERISGASFSDPAHGPINDPYGGGLFWQKFTAVQNMLDETISSTGERACRWVMWLDADAIITSPTLSLDAVLHLSLTHVTHAEKDSIHVVLPHDINNRPVNAGVFFVRNSEQGRSFIASATAMYALFKDRSFPEQDAMTTLSFVDHKQVDGEIVSYPHQNVATVPQRIFNAFGVDPDLEPKYAEDARWHEGDFIAHFAGMIHTQRDLVIPKYLSRIEW